MAKSSLPLRRSNDRDHRKTPPLFVRRRTVAVTVSGLAHLALLTAFFAPSAKSSSPPAGPPEGQGVLVSLFRLPSQASTVAPSSQMSALESLRQQLQAASPPSAQALKPSPAPASSAQAILAAFDRPHPPKKATVSDPAPAKAGSVSPPAHAGQGGSSAKPIEDPLALASFSPQTLNVAAASGLWPQVARCWRPAGPKGVQVRLSVSLDARGQLIGPPQVIGPPAGQGDRDLAQAQAEAIDAVMACAPYASGAQNAVLEFGPAGAG
jgi:hypothetical protein